MVFLKKVGRYHKFEEMKIGPKRIPEIAKRRWFSKEESK